MNHSRYMRMHLLFIIPSERVPVCYPVRIITRADFSCANNISMNHTKMMKKLPVPTETRIRKILPMTERINIHNCYLV